MSFLEFTEGAVPDWDSAEPRIVVGGAEFGVQSEGEGWKRLTNSPSLRVARPDVGAWEMRMR